MQLANRITKGEKSLNLDSEFCRCEGEILVEFIKDCEQPSKAKLHEQCGRPVETVYVTFQLQPPV